MSGTARLRTDHWEDVPASWHVSLVDTKGTDSSADNDTVRVGPDRAYTFELEAPSDAQTKRLRSGERAQEPKRPDAPVRVRSLTEAASGPTAKASSPNAERTSDRFALRIDIDRPLPVARTKAVAEKRGVTLRWTTTSAAPDAEFHIGHKRLPGKTKKTSALPREWDEIASLSGKEASTGGVNYRYRTDELRYGMHAFRLRVIDSEGTTTVSEPVSTPVRLKKAFSIAPPYPNPASQAATLPTTVQNRQRVPARTTVEPTISTRGLSSGAYFLRVRGESFVETRRPTVTRYRPERNPICRRRDSARPIIRTRFRFRARAGFSW